MEISTVPEIINSKGIKISDTNGVQVTICKRSIFKFNYNNFKNPFFIIDNFEKEKFVEIDIKRIELPDIHRLGFRLVSVDIKGSGGRNMRNYSGQRKSYMLKKRDELLITGYELLRVPKEHFLEMDVINKRIRIKGRSSYPYRKNENSSEWINVENG